MLKCAKTAEYWGIVDMFKDNPTTLNHTNQTLADKLAYGGDRLAIGHDPPGVAKEEATSMKKARGKAQDLLQPPLHSSPVGPLLKNYLLVGVVLSKGIHWNQVRPAETEQVAQQLSRECSFTKALLNKNSRCEQISRINQQHKQISEQNIYCNI